MLWRLFGDTREDISEMGGHLDDVAILESKLYIPKRYNLITSNVIRQQLLGVIFTVIPTHLFSHGAGLV